MELARTYRKALRLRSALGKADHPAAQTAGAAILALESLVVVIGGQRERSPGDDIREMCAALVAGSALDPASNAALAKLRAQIVDYQMPAARLALEERLECLCELLELEVELDAGKAFRQAATIDPLGLLANLHVHVDDMLAQTSVAASGKSWGKVVRDLGQLAASVSELETNLEGAPPEIVLMLAPARGELATLMNLLGVVRCLTTDAPQGPPGTGTDAS